MPKAVMAEVKKITLKLRIENSEGITFAQKFC